jgi:hypothetical protein
VGKALISLIILFPFPLLSFLLRIYYSTARISRRCTEANCRSASSTYTVAGTGFRRAYVSRRCAGNSHRPAERGVPSAGGFSTCAVNSRTPDGDIVPLLITAAPVQSTPASLLMNGAHLPPTAKQVHPAAAPVRITHAICTSTAALLQPIPASLPIESAQLLP